MYYLICKTIQNITDMLHDQMNRNVTYGYDRCYIIVNYRQNSYVGADSVM